MSAIAMGPHYRTAHPADRRPARVVAPARPGVGGLVLTVRGRLSVVALGAALLLAGVFAGGHALADAPASPQHMAEHVVMSGETLWGIAASVAAPGESVGDRVAELVRVNGLPSSDIMAGQTIVVPQG